ncbi:MAG: hypothetical protein ACOC1K_02825 [Nanoarchaeota archaeon]
MIEQFEQAISYFNHVILNRLKDIDCWVAGGAVRDYFMYGYPKSDVDIFFFFKRRV